ncbi:MAG: Low-specificity L-threonine aldolase, partial [Acidimicrobiales bacterium]|nr:Low-specificity L-threonine aldolase [Acidimicrobiales bacterium]
MPPPTPDTLFASDNASGVHPAVLAALVAANTGHALAYGADPWSERAIGALRDLLGVDAEVAFTWGGTGANVVGLQCLLAPWQAVICADSAHIAVDECGAPERFTGCKLVDLPTSDGKLRPEQVLGQLHGVGDEHHVQPRVVSITQSTELGTVYAPGEIAALAEVAHANGLLLHVDGARIANAVAALGVDLPRVVVDTGVDVLTFGGTKNGMMYGEAVMFLTPGLGEHVAFVRKQAAQLPSKMRYVAAQFEALLADELWLRNAQHANAMAALLAERVGGIDGVEVLHPPEVNAVFAKVPKAAIGPLTDWSFFWEWDHDAGLVRWMCSFDTTESDVERFAAGIADIVA